MLVGRTAERAAIDEMLRSAQSGRGRGVVVHGEPGIGKSALLDYAAAQAEGMVVLRTVGLEPESDIGNSTLHRLLLPVLDRMTSLPEPQRRALQVVLGKSEGSPDRFLVALAVLSLLAEVAVEQPVLCLVDDAHWCDGPSLDTVCFVARRLEAEPIAIVLAARLDEARRLRLDGLAEMPLTGLGPAEARELLVRHGGDRLSAAERDHVVTASGGNPLALRELPESVTEGVDLHEPLALAAGLQDAFLRRVRRRSQAVQRLLLLVAVEGSGRIETIRRAAADLGLEDGPLVSGELDDLLGGAGVVPSSAHTRRALPRRHRARSAGCPCCAGCGPARGTGGSGTPGLASRPRDRRAGRAGGQGARAGG